MIIGPITFNLYKMKSVMHVMIILQEMLRKICVIFWYGKDCIISFASHMDIYLNIFVYFPLFPYIFVYVVQSFRTNEQPIKVTYEAKKRVINFLERKYSKVKIVNTSK